MKHMLMSLSCLFLFCVCFYEVWELIFESYLCRSVSGNYSFFICKVQSYEVSCRQWLTQFKSCRWETVDVSVWECNHILLIWEIILSWHHLKPKLIDLTWLVQSHLQTRINQYFISSLIDPDTWFSELIAL